MSGYTGECTWEETSDIDDIRCGRIREGKCFCDYFDKDKESVICALCLERKAKHDELMKKVHESDIEYYNKMLKIASMIDKKEKCKIDNERKEFMGEELYNRFLKENE